MSNYVYSVDDLYNLFSDNSSPLLSYMTKEDGKLVIRNAKNMREQRTIFTSLGAHINFCMSFDVDLDDNYQCPSIALKRVSYNSLFVPFIFNNSPQNLPFVNTISATSMPSASYSKLQKTNHITVAKQGFKVWMWINYQLVKYCDMSFNNDAEYASTMYLTMYFARNIINNTDVSPTDISYCAIYNFECSMCDDAIIPQVTGDNFYLYGTSATLDASNSTQDNGSVSCFWDGVSGGLSHTETMLETKIVKLDLIGSQGGHLTTYHKLILAESKKTQDMLLADLYNQFKNNYISNTSGSFKCKQYLTSNGLEFNISDKEAPAELNSDLWFNNGVIEFEWTHQNSNSRSYGYGAMFNLAQIAYEGAYISEGYGNIHTQASPLGISINDEIDYKINIKLGTNLKLADGTSFVGNSNLDIWQEKYGTEYLPNKTNNTCVTMSSSYAAKETTRKIKILKYSDELCVYFNNIQVCSIKCDLLKDLAFNFFAIQQCYAYTPTYSSRNALNNVKFVSATTQEDGKEEDLLPLEEVLAGQGDSPRMAVMVESDALSEPICLYRGYKAVYLKDSNDVIREFKPTGMTIELPERKSGSADSLSFGIGDVSGEVLAYCEQIRTSANPAYITVFQYAPFNELSNGKHNAGEPIYALKLFITSCAITTKGATFSAGWHDTLNAKFPFTRYTAKEFPGLKYVV